jgi:hypothetical protein
MATIQPLKNVIWAQESFPSGLAREDISWAPGAVLRVTIARGGRELCLIQGAVLIAVGLIEHLPQQA